MRYAAKVFAPFQHFRKVAVFGSARTSPDAPEYQIAEDFGREMVAHNYMIITGGGDGIMGAAQRGAGRKHSFGLNIRLPFEQRANEIIEGDPKLINLNYFFTRKLNFVKEAHAFALFPGGFGTLDETFEVLTLMQTGKARLIPVVLLDRPRGSYWETWMKFLTGSLLTLRFISSEDFSFFKIVHNVKEAVAEICSSIRFITRRAGLAKSLSSAFAIGCRKKRIDLNKGVRWDIAEWRDRSKQRCVRKNELEI
jgi:uncharacterized protein (TIGR00730 family)